MGFDGGVGRRLQIPGPRGPRASPPDHTHDGREGRELIPALKHPLKE